MVAAERVLAAFGAHGSLASPQTPQSTGESDTASGSASGLKWFKRPRRQNARDHPYVFKAMSLQDSGVREKRYECAAFFPLVEALRPPRPMREGKWEDWENVIAIAADDRVIVAKCSDAEPYMPLFEVVLPDDELFHVAWTYDPFALRPVIAAGGNQGLIYMIDAHERECTRILRGHGDEILSLAFSPHLPHMLASSSGDKTTRLWNIFGGDVAPPNIARGERRSENFPMGDADEGTASVAILAGEGGRGHRSKVVGVAWHPRHRALATCSLDNTIKIWALPDLPMPKADEGPTPPGYRPTVVYFPVFSTSRIHSDFVDSVDWVQDDVLVSRSSEEIIIWQWLGYHRYFTTTEFAPLHLTSQSTDYLESHSFMVCARYPLQIKEWYQRFSVHRAFEPRTPDEQRMAETDRRYVTDMLVAVGGKGKIPEIRMFNPILARPGEAPEIFTKLRYDSEYETDGEDTLDSLEDGEGARMEADAPTPVSMAASTPRADLQLPNPNPAAGLSSAELVKLRTHHPTPSSPAAAAGHSHSHSKAKSAGGNPNTMWHLDVKGFDKVVRKSKWAQEHGLAAKRNKVRYVAISPRGARWVVGVGVGGFVGVWG